jgi:hypothetical protein
MTTKEIIKQNGIRVFFDSGKLCESMVRAGASEKQAQRICDMVDQKLQPGMTTSKIFRETLRELVKEDLDIAVKYSIKRGINALGPDGFLFEKFIEAMLRMDGYSTRRNQNMKGRCVTHEVDVLAWKGTNYYMIEAKYRNEPDVRTHINTVMYADARMKDIASNNKNNKEGRHHFHTWLITNTEFTNQSTRFSKCADVRLTGWNYPDKDSLQNIIVRTKAYPITVIPSLSKDARTKLSEYGLVLAQDLLPYTKEKLIKDFGIKAKTAAAIQSDVAAILK